MPSFSQTSLDQLATCDPRLQRLCHEAIRRFDFKVIEGHRGQQAQHQAFIENRSKLDWPNGKHNALPSRAVDLAPCPIDWKDEKRWHYFIGYMIGLAQGMGINIISGHDWDHDGNLEEHSFQDSPHFELY